MEVQAFFGTVPGIKRGFGVRRNAGVRGLDGAKIIMPQRGELPVEPCKKVNRWPETHDCKRAREHDKGADCRQLDQEVSNGSHKE